MKEIRTNRLTIAVLLVIAVVIGTMSMIIINNWDIWIAWATCNLAENIPQNYHVLWC